MASGFTRRGLVGGAMVASAAAPGDARAQSRGRVEQWGLQEITLRSRAAYDNPFKDVSVEGVFSLAGREIVVPGFYDGDGIWRVRFMPDTAGRWNYQTRSRDPELNAQAGHFSVAAARGDNRGPVRAEGRRFVFANGDVFIPFGTTLYNWLNRADALQRQTLATLRTSPSNKVRFCLHPK